MVISVNFTTCVCQVFELMELTTKSDSGSPEKKSSTETTPVKKQEPAIKKEVVIKKRGSRY